MNSIAPHLLQRLFHHAPEILCIADAEGVVRSVNEASRRLLGLEPEDLVGRSLALFVFEEDVSAADALFRELTPDAPMATRVLRFRVGAGVLRRIRWSVRLDEESGLRYAMAWDVTQKQLAQTRYRAATEASPTAIIMVDTRGVVVLANHAALEMLGYAEAELVGSPVERLVPPDVRAGHPEHRDSFQRRPAVRPMGLGRDLHALAADGTRIAVEVGLSPVRVDAEVHTVVSLVDVTERNRSNREIRHLAEELQRANAALEELAVTDPLTGLWNRRKFFDEAKRLMKLLQQTGGAFSLIMADLDDFKSVNDEYGHPVGDAVLQRVAEVLQEVREGSDFPARYGGEEFVVALPGTGAERAVGLAERLRAAVEALSPEPRPMTMSLGVATLEELGDRGSPVDDRLARLLNEADKALYRSKALGKNRVVHALELAPEGESAGP